MNKHFDPTISEEKFAAWLDGMLPADEMFSISQQAEHDTTLRQLSEISSVLDAEIFNIDARIPDDIYNAKFEIPTLPNGMISPLVKLSPEPADELFVAAAACPNEDMSLFSNNSQDDNRTIESDSLDNLIHHVPDSDNLGNNDDISDTLSNDL